MIYFISKQTNLIKSELFEMSSLQHCFDYFKNKKEIEIDTETEFCKWGKDRLPDPYTSKALSLQLGDFNNQYVIDLTTIAILELSILNPLFINPEIVKIFCNAFFDLRYFNHWQIKINNIWDIFLVESCIYKGQTLPEGFRSLKGMSERYLGINRDKTIRGQIHYRGLDSAVIQYAAEDVQYMGKIKEKQIEKINAFPINIQKYINLENRYVYDLSLMSYHGIYLDKLKWLKVSELNKLRQIVLQNQMAAWLIQNRHYEFATQGLFGPECSINWNSAKQVLPLLKKLGVNVFVRDKEKGGNALKESADLKNLKKQSQISEFLPLYIEFKELEKEISTYGEDFLIENINPKTNRIHSEFFQILDTSRISSNRPNMQNIPSTNNLGEVHDLRKAFTAPVGKVLIDCDFSQQEP